VCLLLSAGVGLCVVGAEMRCRVVCVCFGERESGCVCVCC